MSTQEGQLTLPLFAVCEAVHVGDNTYQFIVRKPKVMMSVADAAKALNASPSSVRRWFQQGNLAGEVIGERVIRIPAEEVQRYKIESRDPEITEVRRKKRLARKILASHAS